MGSSEEPVYEYVKGKGWIQTSSETYLRVYRGKSYFIEIIRRVPLPGEYGWWTTLGKSSQTIADQVGWYKEYQTFGWLCKGSPIQGEFDECVTVRTFPVNDE